jgi:hypothetical protein
MAKSLALHEAIQALFGFKTTFAVNRVLNNAMVAVNLIAPADPRRVGLTIFNLSANIVYLSPQTDVSATKGIRLAASGGSISLIWDRDFELCSTAWYCMASADTSAVYVLETIGM